MTQEPMLEWFEFDPRGLRLEELRDVVVALLTHLDLKLEKKNHYDEGPEYRIRDGGAPFLENKEPNRIPQIGEIWGVDAECFNYKAEPVLVAAYLRGGYAAALLHDSTRFWCSGNESLEHLRDKGGVRKYLAPDLSTYLHSEEGQRWLLDETRKGP